MAMATSPKTHLGGMGPDENYLRPSDSTVSIPRQFFKIIASSNIDDQKLRIPEKFAREFGNELSNVATLTVPTGRVWQVGLKRAKREIWFVDGWQEFAEYHSLCYGHLLVFRFEGDSKFHVCIFDRSASEIDYPCIGPSSNQEHNCDVHCNGFHEEGAEDDNDSIEILDAITPPSQASIKGKRVDQMEDASTRKRHKPMSQQNQVRHSLESGLRLKKCLKRGAASMECLVSQSANETRRKKFKHEAEADIIDLSNVKKSKRANLNENRMPCSHELPTKQNDDKELSLISNILSYASPRRCNMTSEESEKVIHAARMFKPKNPFFSVILRSYNFVMRYLRVPSKFAKKYMSGWSESIKLQDSNGKQWDVQGFSPDGAYAVSRIGKGGCTEFLKENNLEQGDVCLFELIKKDGVLKVSVFREAEYAGMVHEKRNKTAASLKYSEFQHACENRSKRHTYEDEEADIKLEQVILNENGTSHSHELSVEHEENAGILENSTMYLSFKLKNLAMSKETKRAVSAARAFKPQNPSFLAIMRYYNMLKFVLVPTEFVKNHMLGSPTFIKLEDSNGKQWRVRCTYKNLKVQRGIKKISAGWPEFSMDNNLKEGDVCVFELISSKEFVLKVSIFRASEYARPINTRSN